MRTVSMSLAALLLVGCTKSEQHKQDQIELTHLRAKKLAFEAFPQWAMANPSKECPDALVDLTKYMNDADVADSWKRPLVMFCGANLPAGAKGLAVKSLGPDGVDNTADDIKSWE